MAIDKSIPAWHLSASQYCIQQNVKQPYICEISPMQMGMMSKRQKVQYDKVRSAEWDAAIKCKDDWRQKVVDAYRAGTFDWRTPPSELHPEARSACIHADIAQKKANKAEAWKAFCEANAITKPADVAVGERVFDIMYGGYVHVVKLFPKGLRVKLEREGETAKPYTADARRFQRLKYNDAQAAFEEAYSAE